MNVKMFLNAMNVKLFDESNWSCWAQLRLTNEVITYLLHSNCSECYIRWQGGTWEVGIFGRERRRGFIAAGTKRRILQWHQYHWFTNLHRIWYTWVISFQKYSLCLGLVDSEFWTFWGYQKLHLQCPNKKIQKTDPPKCHKVIWNFRSGKRIVSSQKRKFFAANSVFCPKTLFLGQLS